MPDYAHPDLFAGFNADPINGDVADGPGTNWPVWPVLFDCFIPLQPLIITEEMLAVFDGCADILIADVDNVDRITGEDPYLLLGDPWPDWILPPPATTVTFQRGPRRQAISKVSSVITPRGANDTMTLKRGPRSVAIGRRR